MPTQPPVAELDFLKFSGNHAELSNKLSQLNCGNGLILEYAKFVCEAWFKLGESHLGEAKLFLHLAVPRATYSRSYYAAYNSSKAVRYLVNGQVSLKGDDHKQATSLPDDFPNAASWASKISLLYEDRLRADYDNWASTSSGFTQTPSDSVAVAEQFIADAKTYLNTKFGLTL